LDEKKHFLVVVNKMGKLRNQVYNNFEDSLMQRIGRFIFLFFSIGFLAACNVFKPSIFDSPCSLPCWSHITPGSSNIQDVLKNLKANPKVNVTSIKPWSIISSNDSIIWYFKDVKEPYGSVILKDGIVSEIEIALYNTSIEEMIKHFGEPEKIFAENIHVEPTYVVINVLYPQKGLAFSLQLTPDSKGKVSIKPTDSVDGVWYYSPANFRAFMENSSMSRLKPELLDQGLQPWTGYGNVQYVFADNGQ
jgi:hypothetical protein